MASNVELNAGSGGASLLTKEVTHDGDTAHLQGVHILGVSGSEGSYTATNISSPTDGLLVNLGSNNDVTVTGTVTANLSATDNGVLDDIAASLAAMDDWDESDRAKVNLIVGQAGVAAGAGAVGATVIRVTLASDDPGVALLGTIDADTSTLAGAVSGSEMQVDVVTLPTTVHSADYDSGAGTDTTLAFGIAVPASGGAAVIPGDATAGLKVDLGADNDVTVSGTVAVTQSGTWDEVGINDSGNSITVDAPVGTPVFVRLSDGSSAIATLPVSLASVPSHAVTNAGTFAVQVDGAALAALQLIDNIVLVEDAAAAGGESGIMPLAVRKDSAGTLASADGDFTPLQVDASGSLRVTGGGGGTEYTEDAAAAADPVGTSLILIRKDTPAAITSADGDNVAMRGSDYGAAYVTLVDNAGSFVSVGGGTQYDEDTAHVTGDKVTMAGVVRADTAAAQSGTDGDRTVLITDASGRLHVNVGNTVTVASHPVTNAGTFATQVDGAALTSLQLIDNLVLAEDAAHQTADPGVQMLAVRKATPANVSGTDGDYEPLQVSGGRLWASATIDAALPAGTNAIGKLAANSGVDIGDVDVTSISAGTNNIGNVGLIGRTSGGLSIFKSLDLDESEEEIKATAGQVFSISAFNRTAAPLYLKFYNLTAANTTVGTSTPVATFVVPANADSDGAGFIWNNTIGLAFSTAISAAVTTGVADSDTGAPGANDCVVVVGYV